MNITIQKDLPPIQRKEKTIYLGQVMSFKNKMDLENNRRKSLAWNKLWRLKYIFKNNEISLQNKIKDLNKSCVVSLCRPGPLRELERTQRVIIRSILQIKRRDHIKTESMYKKTMI